VLGDEGKAKRRHTEAIDTAHTNVGCVTETRQTRRALAQREFEIRQRHCRFGQAQDLYEFAARLTDNVTLAQPVSKDGRLRGFRNIGSCKHSRHAFASAIPQLYGCDVRHYGAL
jgi:hypothetical protein